MNFFRLSIRATLLTIIGTLSLIVALLTGVNVYKSWQKLDGIRQLKETTYTVTLLYNAEKYYSLERGLTMAILNVSPERARMLLPDLNKNRENADKLIKIVSERIDKQDLNAAAITGTLQNSQQQVIEMRQLVDGRDYPMQPADKERLSDLAFDSLTNTTSVVKTLITELNTPLQNVNPDVYKHMYFKHFIWEITEYAGREFAQISRLIAENRVPHPDLQKKLIAWKERTSYGWEIALRFAEDSGLDDSMASQIEEARAHYFFTFEQIKDMFYELGDKRAIPPYPINLEVWLEMAPQAIESLMELKDAVLNETQIYIDQLEAQAKRDIFMQLVVFLCALGLGAYSWWVIRDRVINPVNTMVDSLYSEANILLPEYLSNLTHKDEIEKLAVVLQVFQGYSKRLEATSSNLEQQKNYLKTVLETILDAIIAVDRNGTIVMANPAVKKIFGYDPAELEGQNIKNLMPLFYAWEDDDFIKRSREIKEERIIETEARHKEGQVFPIDLLITDMKSETDELILCMVRDITERKLADRKLLEYTLQLQRSNKELDDFVYIVSHDLKEPVRGLYAFSQFLQEDYSDRLDKEGQSKLETLKKLSIRMEELIDTLLYYSRLGKGDMAYKDVDLNETVQKTLELIDPVATEKHASILIDNTLPTIRCDSARVGEIFRNLIVNGIKYNDKENKEIHIGCLKDYPDFEGKSVFYVKDNGIGIPQKHYEAVFKMFKRLHGRDQYGGGTGSGLPIIKKIIDRHNGKIWINSSNDNGTTFFFTLGA